MSILTSSPSSTELAPPRPSAGSAPPPSASRAWLALGVALLPVVLLVVWRWSDGFGVTAGDWAQYLMHARALAERHAYGDIGYLYSRYDPWVGPPAEPPGLPLTLAPVLAVFGPNLAMVHVVIVVSLLVGLLVVWRYFSPRLGDWPAAAVVAFTGVALIAAGGVNNVIADVGFFALVWAVILLVDQPGALDVRRLALITVLGAAAVAYRTAGAALVPALVLYAVVNRRPRVLVPVAIWAALGLAFVARMSTGVNVLSTIGLRPAELASTIAANAQAYATGAMLAFLRPLPWSAAARAYHLLAALIALVGARILLEPAWRRSFAVAFAIAYVAMLLVVPVREARYLWPLFPLVIASLVSGARWLAARVGSPPARAAAPAAALLVVGAVVVQEAVKPRTPTVTDVPAVQRVLAVADSLHRTEDARFVFVNPRVLTWTTRAPAMILFRAPVPQTMSELRRARITHVVLGDLGDAAGADSSMAAAIAANPTAFRLERREGGFAIYRVLPGAGPPSR